MIFIKYNSSNIVENIHYMPFDEQHGLGKTQTELEKEGALVDIIPVPQNQPNKQAILKYNTTTKQLYYEYINAPLTPEEEIVQLKEQVKSLEDTILKTQGVI